MSAESLLAPPRTACWTHRGGRSANQDAAVAVSLDDGRELLAVADGMGGHAGGEMASHAALEALERALRSGAGLADAVRAANAEVCRLAASAQELYGMGTTLVAYLRHGAHYEIANVGDSRAYHLGASGLRQLTLDHSFVAEAVRSGEMSEAEALRSPWKHAVTRSLGAADDVDVDVFGPFPTTEPHRVLLCTDGIYKVLSDDEIARLLAGAPEPRDAAALLGERAIEAGTGDNVTAAVAILEPVVASTVPLPAPTAPPPGPSPAAIAARMSFIEREESLRRKRHAHAAERRWKLMEFVIFTAAIALLLVALLLYVRFAN